MSHEQDLLSASMDMLALQKDAIDRLRSETAQLRSELTEKRAQIAKYQAYIRDLEFDLSVHEVRQPLEVTDAERRSQACKMRRSGKSLRKIAAVFGVSEKTIRNWTSIKSEAGSASLQEG